jgi:hypothetical protein
MSTSGNSFDLILQEVQKQKRVLEEMQAENQSLRQQLAELRAGKGISIDILGERFMLNSDGKASSPDVVSDAPNEFTDTAIREVPALMPAPSAPTSPVPVEPSSDGATAILNETPAPEARDTSDDFLLEEVSDDGSPFPTPAPATAFLEEALLEEFASATTRQMSAWNGPITNHPTLDEHEKATLRRELMGSFLLE